MTTETAEETEIAAAIETATATTRTGTTGIDGTTTETEIGTAEDNATVTKDVAGTRTDGTTAVIEMQICIGMRQGKEKEKEKGAEARKIVETRIEAGKETATTTTGGVTDRQGFSMDGLLMFL